ncbi:MAG TPA: phosphatase PAP2 family protein [Kofleriaceae bacterium]|nr:phosphatase PAP2 family protein [Kofleriaceae bacterium]
MLRAAAVLAVLFAGCAVVAVIAPGNAFDLAVERAIQGVPGVAPLARGVSWFGNSRLDIVAPIAIGFGLLAVGLRLEVAALAASTLGATALTHLVKWLVDRARPATEIHVLETAHGASFPSGHVTEYVALAGVLAVFAHALIRDRVVRRTLIVFAFVPIVLVGPARVYLGAHWPTDVIGGYALAGAWLALVAQIYARQRARRLREPRRLRI